MFSPSTIRLTLMFTWLLLIAGCAPRNYLIQTRHDDVSGSTKNRLITGTTLIDKNNILDNSVSLDIERIDKGKNEFAYMLHIAYMNKTWLFIQPGESLHLILDGTIILGLKGDGSLNYRKTISLDTSNRMMERASYPLTSLALKKIAKAKSVDVLIKGDVNEIKRSFSDEALENYRAFNDQFGGK